MDDHPDLGSFRLLPQLYRNLSRQGVDDPLLLRFKGVARKEWYKNQRFFSSVVQPVEVLNQAGIQSMLLYDPAMALRCASDYRIGTTATLAILVPTRQAICAAECLGRNGWISESGMLSALMANHLSLAYMHAFNDTLQRRIQLHWHLLPECCQLEADQEFWAGAVTVKLHDTQVLILDPADHLLHICVQDTMISCCSTFVRAVDAMLLIQAAREELDWARLIRQATERGLVLPVISVLDYLQANLADPIPDEALAKLRAMPVPKQQQVEFRLKNSQILIWRRLLRLWFNYLRGANGLNWPRKVVGFAGYLKHYWRLDHWWQLPLQAVSALRYRWR
jgi:hypothetical protein